MDNSRNVLRTPADSFIHGRFSSQAQNQNSFIACQGFVIELIFASRDLVRNQFTRHVVSGQIICVECRSAQKYDGLLNRDAFLEFGEHDQLCRTGRVLRTLNNLLAIPLYSFPIERSASRDSSEPVSAAVEERPRALPAVALFGEPWTVDPESAEIRDAYGRLIVDPYGSELVEGDELNYSLRIADCVNSFAGLQAPKQIGGATC